MTNTIKPISIQQVAKKAKSNIIQHVGSSTLSDQLKVILLNEVEAEKNVFYFCYASLFTEKGSREIDKINLAGYFYYKYLIATDELVDSTNPSKNTFKLLILSNFFHEESIRLLSDIFLALPEFWEYWGIRKAEYLNAFQTDKKYLTSLSDHEFHRLADNKSANGKVAIDSLLIVGAINKKEYEAMLLSHKLFSCGFQYYDDVLDLKQDINNKQTNVALCELKKIMSPDDFSEDLENAEKMHKLMHIKGVASMLLEKSINCFENAEEVLSEIDCPYWKQVIELKKKEVNGILKNVNFYLESIRIKMRLSNKKRTFLNDHEIDIQKVILYGIDFIAKEQEQNGQWRDTPVNTWLSGYWTTGYVLNALSYCDHDLIKTINSKSSINYLDQRSTPAWGYIEGWVEDADSTNFALLGLIANNKNVNDEIKELLTYQNEDGGFSTYKNAEILLDYLSDPQIKDVAGWVQSHVCVSAGTLLVLSKVEGFEKEKNKLIHYLLQNISENKMWNSYWWTSDIYATALIMEASININNELLNKAVEDATVSLLKLQQQNGLFEDDFNKEHVFYSGLILNSLCSDQKFFTEHQVQITKLANGLLNKQNEDGSWDSSYALRVPAADCIDPKLIGQWKKSDLGQNVIIEDIHRIITTSTVLAALSRYEKRAVGN